MKWLDRTIGWAVSLSLAAAALATPLPAQMGGDGYLFRSPIGSLNVRGGFAHAMAGSDVFSFSRKEFTLGGMDFSGPQIGGDLSFFLSDRVQFVAGGSYAGSVARSEYREFEEDNDQPVEQTTTFLRVPVTGSLKMYLSPPGREIGRFAWVPAGYAPYVGAGGGGLWYRFQQEGDFINTETLIIRTDRLRSSGWTKTAHAFAGMDLSLSPRFALTGEARYDWGQATLDDASYEGFEPIDLSGLSVTAGLSIRL